MRGVSLLGLGSALPAHAIPRERAEAWMAGALAADPDAVALSRRVMARAGVERRYSCVGDFARSGEPLLLGSRSPSTAARMAAYREHAPALAERACRRALASAGIDAATVTDLVVVSCTGFSAPGLDVDLVARLGLDRGVERTLVGFMGCCAAFNGIRVGGRAVLARPGGRALVACVELCSLHFRPDPSPDSIVAFALFGDAAAAVVLGGAGEAGLARFGATATEVDPSLRDAMTWEIGDDGFRMRLSSAVPRAIGERVAGFVQRLNGGDAASWCVHPGGRSILDRIGEELGLPASALASSRGVLRDVGNVSSASVILVLERELTRIESGATGLMLGFGPGLTMEGLTFERGARPFVPGPEEGAAGG